MMATGKKELPVINYYATCGKETGMHYPGAEWVGEDKSKRHWRQNPITREMVDKLPRPYQEKLQRYENPYNVPCKYLGPHESEGGWNVPTDHPRHLLNLPAEVLERILGHCVVMHFSNESGSTVPTLTPECVKRTSGYGKKLPSYACTGYRNDLEIYRTLLDQVEDQERGEFSDQLVKIWKRPVDATVLRVCKIFHEQGRRLLYSKNTFRFRLHDNYPQTRTWLDPKTARLHTPGKMPRLSELQSPEFREDVCHLMDQDNLDRWTFNDPFTRFLKTIGPQNASFIQRLHFDGSLYLPSVDSPDQDIEHATREKGCNLLWYLQAYSHFINSYCPDVRYFNINILDFGKKSRFRWRWAAWDFIFCDVFDIVDDIIYDMNDEEEDDQDNPMENATRDSKAEWLSGLQDFLLSLELGQRAAFKALIGEIIPEMRNLQHFEVTSSRLYAKFGLRDDREPELEPDAWDEWIYEADEDMTWEVKDLVRAAFRERSKHPEIVAANEKLGFSDSEEAAHARCVELYGEEWDEEEWDEEEWDEEEEETV